MGKQQSDLDKLYGAVSEQLDIGSIEQFKSKMQTKEDRKKFYDVVSKNGLDLGDYSQYESRLGKQNAVSLEGSKNTASILIEPSQPYQPNIVSNLFGGQTQEQFIGEENARRIKSESAKPKTIDFSKGQVKVDQRNQIEKDLSIKRAEKVQSKGTDVMNSLGAGVNQAYAGIAKIPRYIFEAFGVPQNLLADAVLNNAGEDLLSGIRTTGKEYDTLLNWMQGGNPLANSPLTALDRIGDIFQGRAEEFQAKQTKYDKGVFDSIVSGDLGEAGAQIVNNIAQSAPSMLTMATTSGLGNVARLGSVGRTVINALPFASSKANEIREDESIPDGIKPIYSGLYALAEVIYDEKFGTQALLNKVVETATKQGGREIAEREVKDFAKGYLSSAFAKIKEPVTDVTKNVIEEMATQLSQNVLDKVVVDPNKDLMEGVLDAGIVALGTGVGLTSVNTIIRPSVKSSINQKNQQIENLSNDLDNTDIDDNSKEVILNKIANIKKEINSELTTEKENFDKLPEAVKEEALEVSGRINTIENSLANPNISEDSKTTLTEETKVLENRLNQITQQTTATPQPSPEQTEIVLFHGTPHKFEGFSINRIGTGEGNQAFGRGLYFTNERSIAEDYSNNISSKQKFWQHLLDGNDISLTREDYDFINDELDALGFDGSRAEDSGLTEISVDGTLEYGAPVYEALAILFGKNAKSNLKYYGLTKNEIDRLIEIKNKINDPQLYEVSIGSERNFIPWDADLSENQISAIGEGYSAGVTGKQVYNDLTQKLGSQQKASDFLNSKGIDGIIYKSNKGTGGVSGQGINYVVFDDSIIKINSINNQPISNNSTLRNITENNQQQREGTIGQQQGQQENRQNQETVVSQTEEVTGNSNSPIESRQVQEEINTRNFTDKPSSLEEFRKNSNKFNLYSTEEELLAAFEKFSKTSSTHEQVINDLARENPTNYLTIEEAIKLYPQLGKVPQEILDIVNRLGSKVYVYNGTNQELKTLEKYDSFWTKDIKETPSVAYYPASGSDVFINATMFGKQDPSVSLLAHELSHVFTGNLINTPDSVLKDYQKEFKTDINKYYKFYKKTFGDGKSRSITYGFRNPAEFVSEYMTNSKFRKLINDRDSSFLTKIRKYFNKLLGRNYSIEELNNVFDTFNKNIRVDLGLDTEQTIEQQDSQTQQEITIEETVPTPPQDRIQEIRDRRQQIYTRIRQKTTANSGINPEILTDLVELGATYIEEGVVRFKDFAQNLRNDFGQEISDQEMRDIYRQSANQLGYNVRGFSESVRNNGNLSNEIRQSVDELDNLYEVQDYEQIGTRLDQMSETEKLLLVSDLSSLTSRLKGSDNIGVLAAIDLLNKYNAEGRTAEATALIDKLSPIGTVAGQLLRQFGELKSSTADGFVQLIKARLKGVDINKEQEQKLRELFTQTQNVRAKREQLTDALYNEPNDKELTKKVKESLIELEDAQRELDDFINSLKGDDIYDRLSAQMRGNLLTFKTQVINITSNISEAFKNGVINIASIVPDKALGLYTGNTTRFINVQRGIGEAMSEGVKKAYRQAKKGSVSTELSNYDTNTRLKPFEDLKRAFIKKDISLKIPLINKSLNIKANRPEDYTFPKGVMDVLSGLTSINARIQYNLLPFADSPFSNAAGRMEANRIAKSLKLSEKEYQQFLIKPDKVSADRITSAEQRQTFQGNNFISRLYNELLGSVNNIKNEHVRGVVKVLIAAISPFVKTPSNLTWAALNLAVPAIPLIRASNNVTKLVDMVKTGKGNTLEAKNLQSDISRDFGAVLVGAAAVQVSIYLIKNLLVTGDAPDEKERKREKDFMYIAQPPNTINITALERLRKGQPTDYRTGDVTISYKAIGLFGNVLGITYKSIGNDILQNRRESKYITIEGNPYYTEKDANNANEFFSALFNNLPASLTYAMDEAYFQGIASTLESFREGKVKGTLGQWGKTISTIGIPNQFTQIMRATDDEYKSVWTEDDWQYAVNILKDRWSGIDDTQIDYDMWGRKKMRNPEGTNPWIYNTIDIFRTQTAQKSNDITYKVLDLLRKTDNTSVIPSPEDGIFKLKPSDKKQTKLRGEARFKLNEFIGKERLKIAQKILKGYTIDVNNTEELDRYVEKLSSGYSRASNIGTRKFKIWLKSQSPSNRKKWGASL